ncbi:MULTISPECIES: cytochrome P450 [unclassified Mycobacterium]|uniref:cytochrome P450 n=1 Tax=unclassified Mycobacterium TaxID=2642494 RepID=UPI00096D6C18|nr:MULTISPECIES: cytochrome P450 [unclassified Mycobacterium]OMC15098.1 cytochrome [Mycobacterium sp. SP-6446]OMC57686.1 cytochrome [Mycobacterium sp. IS-836]
MLRRGAAAGAPTLPVDLYGKETLLRPAETYRQIRDAGAVVWLPKHRLWVMGRYRDVRQALSDDETYCSGNGVAANPVTNVLTAGTTLASDGEAHSKRRRVLLQSLSAKALSEIEPVLQAEATAIVDRLCDSPEFDGVSDFAAYLPIRVVADLVGVDLDHRRMLKYGRGGFDVLGPTNTRTVRAAPVGLSFWRYARSIRSESVKQGGWAESVLAAGQAGTLTLSEAKAMVIDFIGPSLDTTILASAQLLWSLGTQLEVWEELRHNPELVPAAAVEAVRLGSPVRGFTRMLKKDTEIDGTPLRRGQRVALLYASANMDETQFEQPEVFSLHRKGANLGWGFGAHACVGMYLSKMEMHALLRAMIPKVTRIQVDQPVRLLNNTLQGFESLRASFSRSAA